MPDVDSISNNPFNRIPDKTLINDPEAKFDIHCHTFNFDYVPDGFLGIRLPYTRRFMRFVEKILHLINPFSDKDKMSSTAYFVNTGNKKTGKKIADKLYGYYDEKTVLCSLMMDMQPKKRAGVRGKIRKSYYKYIDETRDIRDAYPGKFLPFIAVDPRRKDMFKSVFLKAFSPEYNFFGVKIYPCLGYLPSHPELMKVYEVCEDKNIAVTAHCGGANTRTTYHYIKNIKGLDKNGRSFTKKRWFWRKNDYAEFFNHPKNWEIVLKAFPKLRLNLAHFGSEQRIRDLIKGKDNTWPSRIMDMMDRYENLYTDISYSFHDKKIFHFLKNLLENNNLVGERILYGSDYYMIVLAGHFRSIKTDFITAMGDRIYGMISKDNPRRFLGLEL